MNALLNKRAGMACTLCTALLLGACIQVDPEPDFDKARQWIEASTGRADAYDPSAEDLSAERLNQILGDGLSLDEALHLALNNNRELQAEFQEIGISHADWVQARLLSNPSLDLLLRFPSGGGRSMLEAILGVELLEFWRIPARKEAARQELEASVLRIAGSASRLVAETRNAYHGAVAANEELLAAQENAQLAERSLQSVQELHNAGAADAFDESQARGPWLAAELELRGARIASANAKRALAKKLSLRRNVDDLQLSDPLPLQIPATMDIEALVIKALAARLDLRAIEAAVRALDAHVRLEERKAWGDASAGPAIDRPANSGGKLLGPSLSLTLPIFDQNQAQVARAGFELQKMVKLYAAAQIAITQDVRSAAERVNAAANSLAFYDAEILPHAESALSLVQQSYSAGGSKLDALIEAQSQLLRTRSAHVSLRLEAAIALSELGRVLGAPVLAAEADK